jgi:chemotaxis protein CheD
MEGFQVKAEDLGDIYPRKVIYDPMSGKVQVKKLRNLHNETIVKREKGYLESIKESPAAGDIELFD